MSEDAPIIDPAVTAAAPPAAPTFAVDTLAAALRGAFGDIIPGLVQSQAPRPVVAAAIPNNPLDLLTPEQQANLSNLAIADPASYGRSMAELGARHAELKFQQAAKPFADTNARLLVSDFRNRMQQAESPEDFRQIAPAFDRSVGALNLSPLVQMDEATRSAELLLRWNSAKCDVLANERKNRKPDPTLTAGSSNISSPKGGADKQRPLWLQQMNAAFKFTPEQLKEIEGDS